MPIQKIYADRDYVEEKVQNKISTPETASKGQTIVVKTVDSNGKPTEWEAKSIPTMPETTEPNMQLVTDANGNKVWEEKKDQFWGTW